MALKSAGLVGQGDLILLCVAAWDSAQHGGWVPTGRKGRLPVLLKARPRTGTEPLLSHAVG